ncbi:MAG: class I lanthipeptide [Hyphomicrobiales bacterium]
MKKLEIRKETIAQLNEDNMSNVVGGISFTACHCPSKNWWRTLCEGE